MSNKKGESSSSSSSSSSSPTLPGTKTNDEALTPLGGCHWIPWDAKWVHQIPDPTRIFSILVIAIVMVKYYIKATSILTSTKISDDDKNSTVTINENWMDMIFGYGFCLNPFVLFSFLSTSFIFWYAGDSNKSCFAKFYQLPVYDRWTCEWYYWNAALFHMTMDGFTGSLQWVPLMLNQYQTLDRRFITQHSVPWTVGMIELTIYPIFCWLSMWSILTDSPYRYPAELVTGILHLFGGLVFFISEIYEGNLNVPAENPVGIPGDRFGNLQWFDENQFTYFWFGFIFCNLIWVVVPYYRIQRSFQEIVRRFSIPIPDNYKTTNNDNKQIKSH